MASGRDTAGDEASKKRLECVEMRLATTERDLVLVLGLLMQYCVPLKDRICIDEQCLTVGRIGEEAIAALIALSSGSGGGGDGDSGVEVLKAWGLYDMFTDSKKMGLFKIMDLMVYPQNVADMTYTYVGGPGPLLLANTASAEQSSATPVVPFWGPGLVYPYLINCNLSFFHGPAWSPMYQEPRTSWIRALYQGIDQCHGSAILVFYPRPWNCYLEAMQLCDMIGRGFPNMHFLMQANLHDIGGGGRAVRRVFNAPGTTHVEQGITDDDRQLEVYHIIEFLVDNYCQAVNDPKGRVFTSAHCNLMPGETMSMLESDIMRRLGDAPARQNTLGTRIEESNFRPHAAVPLAPAVCTQLYNVLVQQPYVSDIAAYLFGAYSLALAKRTKSPMLGKLQSRYHAMIASLPSTRTDLLDAAIYLGCKLPISLRRTLPGHLVEYADDLDQQLPALKQPVVFAASDGPRNDSSTALAGANAAAAAAQDMTE